VHVPEERFQKACCLQVRKELVESKAALVTERGKVKRWEGQFEVEVKGGVRRMEAEYAAELEKRQQAELEWRGARDRVNMYRNLSQAQAEDIADLSALVAELKGTLKCHVIKLGAAAKKELIEVRAARMEAARVKADATRRVIAAEKATVAAEVAAARVVEEAESRVLAAVAHAADMEVQVDEAEQVADEALQEAMAERQAAAEAAAAAGQAEHGAMLTKRREERALARANEAERRIAGYIEPWLPGSRSEEEWRSLSVAAEYKAAERERKYLKHVLGEAHPWRKKDVAQVLAELGWVEQLLEEKPFFSVYYSKVEKLINRLEQAEFGVEFGLFLHYEMHLTPAKILRLTQAGCKRYVRVRDAYESKDLLFDKYHKAQGGSAANKYKSIKVPRLAPPVSRLTKIIRDCEARIGVTAGEDGRLAMRSLAVVVQELLAEDPGKHGMPPLPFFLGGKLELPLVISFDGTGFGQLGLNTIAVRNPYMPQSAALLRLIGIGNCHDNKDGTTRLLGDNLGVINEMTHSNSYCCACPTSGEEAFINPHIYGVLDVAALRCAAYP
jgi:hypothetical protein